MPLLMPNLTITTLVLRNATIQGSLARRSTVPIDREDATVIVPSSSHIMICVRRTAVVGNGPNGVWPTFPIIQGLPWLCLNYSAAGVPSPAASFYDL